MWEHDAIDDGPTAAASNDEPTAPESVTDRRLPADVGRNLRDLFGTDDRPETIEAWTDAVAAAFGDEWPPAVEDLCHDEAGRHEAETATATYRFVCVLDAILLPFLTDESVEVRSEGPETGATVTSRVSRTAIETDPADAVLSFGVAPTDPATEPTAERTYESLCPYVHAFPDRDAYDRWAESVDVPTTALPLSEGFGLARALVRA